MAKKQTRARTTVTSLGSFLEKVNRVVELPRGTRLGVKVGHRRLRSDFSFRRPVLSRNEMVKGYEDALTANDAVRQFVIPRLPQDIRHKAKIVIYPPGSRKPADPRVKLMTAREWGDGLTDDAGEVFDQYVEEAYDKLFPIWEETVEDIGEELIFLTAVCKFFDNAKQMTEVIRKHKFG